MENINRRQFIISRKKIHVDGMTNIQLWDNYILAYHEDLHIIHDNNYILLGWAFHCNGTMVQSLTNALLEMRFWSGRWILLTQDRIYADPNASLGIYYDKEYSLISSSLHLIEKYTGKSWNADYVAQRGEGGILDYYPIPCTPVSGVKKLLPSQYITYDCKCCFRTDFMIPRYRGKKIKELNRMFLEGFSGVMESIEKSFPGHIWISLTSGYDSRSNVAAAQKAGINFRTYTAKRPDTPAYELERAEQIAKKLGITNLIIDECGLPSKIRDEEFDVHCGGHVTFGTEKNQYSLGTDVPDARQSIVLWGTMWAMTYKPYEKFMDNASTVDDCYNEIKKYSGDTLSTSSVHRESIKEWLVYVFENPVDGMDWRQRMYWEQRNGAWVSAAQQGLDMIDSVRVSPINCQYLLEIMQSYPKRYQYSKIKEKVMIRNACPEIAAIPFGEHKKLINQLLARATRKAIGIYHAIKR